MAHMLHVGPQIRSNVKEHYDFGTPVPVILVIHVP